VTHEVIYDPNHVAEAQDRLLEQYKGLEDPESLIAIFAQQVQDLEDVFNQLNTEMSIFTAIGAQLDIWGVIVGLARSSSNDDIYRLELLAKIVKNVSQGNPEDLISVYKFVTGADLIIYENLGGGEVMMESDGSVLAGMTVNQVFDLVQQSAGAGIRVGYLALFDPGNPFSFDGTLDTGSGFGTVADSSVGGMFAHLILRNDPFAMDGDDTTTRGFGTISLGDPLVGGNFVGL
jgi:hypothetical protein